jgi:excisionase family DNA binding protein
MISANTKINPDSTYPIGTAARLIGVSASTLRDLERQGKLECTRTPGGQRRFSGSELLRLRDRPTHPKKPVPPTSPSAANPEDVKARAGWLNELIARGQRGLPSDTPAEIRFRLASDLEHALRGFGPESGGGEVELLFNSVVERAKQRAKDADEVAARTAMKAELIDDALAHLRRRIDTLPRRLVGAPTSFERTHVRATLRDQLRDALGRRLRGDETWDQARERADEFLAEWYVEQAFATRVPNTVKLLAAAAAGLAGGAAAAATLDPRIRAAVAKLKDPLRSLVIEALNRFGAAPASPSSPSTQPDQPAPAPPPARPGVGVIGLRASDYMRRWKRSAIARWPHATSNRISRPNGPPTQSGSMNGQPGTDTGGGLPGSA